ncbi:FAD-binding oxidoreductase [Streptomyces xanthophaeus]|uniref:NAD(P)/FAD-dependent oxidoreductase n=1 Tax=Streptomyces xanthophaeus TaxID=67385 RepID=UPI003867CA60|nr:FAD-binding oxidoreductase [Streptomyces xanthophaeus]WST64638.1 FAD-binding oxidoreductase [Streptomyces xanthophaeus]
MTAVHDVLVIGAGVVGHSVARELAQRGARVHVVDGSPDGGSGSRAAAGVAIPSLRLLADPVMHAFVAAARTRFDEDVRTFEKTTPGIRRGRGVLRPVRTEEEREQLVLTTAARPEELGEWTDAAALADLEPVFARSSFLGAFRTAAGHMVDTALYVDALGSAARAAGATVSLGEQVLGIEEAPGAVRVTTSRGSLRADRVVVAAGAWSGSLPGLPPLPVHPMRGQMIEVRDAEVRIDHVISGRTYLCPWRAGSLCTGATEEMAGFADHVTTAGTVFLLSRLIRDFPLLADARPVRAWAGLRSASGDGRLVLGRYPATTRVYVCSAHAGQGILTGHHSGWALAHLLDTGEPAAPEAFSPDRFDPAWAG